MAGNVVRAWRSGLSVGLARLTCKFDPFHSQTLLLCPLNTLPARKPHSNPYHKVTWQIRRSSLEPRSERSLASSLLIKDRLLAIYWSEIWGEGGMGGEM